METILLMINVPWFKYQVYKLTEERCQWLNLSTFEVCIYFYYLLIILHVNYIQLLIVAIQEYVCPLLLLSEIYLLLAFKHMYCN